MFSLDSVNEQLACNALLKVLIQMKNEYADTEEEDERLLNDISLGHIERHAIIFRLSEKRVLSSAIAKVQNYMINV